MTWPLPSHARLLAHAAIGLAFAGSAVTPAATQEVAPPAAVRRLRIEPNKPNALTFAPREARFIRFAIQETESGQPCLDEVEVYGPAGRTNLALARLGARATASSCLPGYAIHQVAHLNDGHYGNGHSWIAAGAGGEWAQIELPAPAMVSTVVFSRDREGRFRDRLPTQFEVRLSADGQHWHTVCRVGDRLALPASANWDDLLRYAFLCEQETWSRIDADEPVTRVLRQMEAMIERLAAKGLDVSAERNELANLRQMQARCVGTPPENPNPGGNIARDADESAARGRRHPQQHPRPEAAAADEGVRAPVSGRGARDPVTTPDAAAAGGADPADTAYLAARLAKRRLFLRDPDLAPLRRILFVARHPYEPSHNYSDILDARWRPGGGVCVLDISQRDARLDPASARLTKLFDAGPGVARDAMADFAARRIYFGYRATADGYYHLRAMNADGSGLRQLTDGPFHDYYPCPLPDGGIAFISTRCRARFLCWRPQAFVLFRMDADGGNILPLSHANLSEWAPSVMRDGRILWTRSEYLDKGADFGHTLWAIRPDGTHPELLFGNNTRNCYVNAHEVPGTSELCCTLISHGGDLNGPIALIDPRQGRFNPAAITSLTPDTPPRYHMDWAQRECFRDPVPVARDYFLVSHAPQRHFGLYVIDRHGNRELLYLDPAIGSFCPTPLQSAPAPPLLAASRAEPTAPAEGTLILQDVYLGLEPTVRRGTVKYLRVSQEVRADLERLPNGEYRQDHPPFEDFYASPTHLVRGPSGWPSYVAKAALGLVPVEADGSAAFYAPAGKVLYFQALDEDLNEIQRMRSVVQLQPGEQRGCVGCHEHRASAPPAGRPLAARQPPRGLESPSWGAGPFAYEKVVQPVWDARCVRCHDANDARKLDFTGTLGPDRVPASYRTLITQGWVDYFDFTWGREHDKAEPLTFGTVRSKLWKLLEAGHYDVKLTRDEMHRVKCWIDLNCPLWPDYLQRELRPKQPHQTVRVQR